MKNFLRSLARIAIGVVVGSAALYAAAALVMRQPVFGDIPFRGASRSDPQALERHVAFLTTDVRPRDAQHVDNLERAAAYIGRAFAASGARVSTQPFDVGGKTYRNVIASFGPDDDAQPLLVVGAHYDAFSAAGGLPGADDNASGTAGLLELARLLGRSPPRAPVALVAWPGRAKYDFHD